MDTVKLSKLKQLLTQIENDTQSDKIDISFEFICAACFPQIYENIKDKISQAYIDGFQDGLKNQNFEAASSPANDNIKNIIDYTNLSINELNNGLRKLEEVNFNKEVIDFKEARIYTQIKVIKKLLQQVKKACTITIGEEEI